MYQPIYTQKKKCAIIIELKGDYCTNVYYFI